MSFCVVTSELNAHLDELDRLDAIGGALDALEFSFSIRSVDEFEVVVEDLCSAKSVTIEFGFLSERGEEPILDLDEDGALAVVYASGELENFQLRKLFIAEYGEELL